MQSFINLNNRLRAMGGNQEQRMQKDKLKSMRKALLYSYQSATITLNNKEYKCLINPDKIKQDYDDKIISIEFEAGARAGDVLYWNETNTYWIIYLTNLEEDSYFRGPIRRCRYDIKYILDGRECITKAAIRGPVETKIVHNLKKDLTFDEPNYTLNILVPNNKDNYTFFKRYSRFMLDGICWEVQATNSIISMDNIIEINAKENYIDPFKDVEDLVGEKIPGIEIFESDGLVSGIRGEGIIQMYEQFKYTDSLSSVGDWEITKPEFIKIIDKKDNYITLEGKKPGVFELIRITDDCKRIRKLRVDSLFLTYREVKG